MQAGHRFSRIVVDGFGVNLIRGYHGEVAAGIDQQVVFSGTPVSGICDSVHSRQHLGRSCRTMLASQLLLLAQADDWDNCCRSCWSKCDLY